MLGPVKSRDLDRPVLASLETLVLKDHFYRQLEQVLDLSFVRDWVTASYAEAGRPSVDPIVFFKDRLLTIFEGQGVDARSLLAQVDGAIEHTAGQLGQDLFPPIGSPGSGTLVQATHDQAEIPERCHQQAVRSGQAARHHRAVHLTMEP